MQTFFLFLCFFFFFKQKTAYEIVPCDWSSDVCSSDLHAQRPGEARRHELAEGHEVHLVIGLDRRDAERDHAVEEFLVALARRHAEQEIAAVALRYRIQAPQV